MTRNEASGLPGKEERGVAPVWMPSLGGDAGSLLSGPLRHLLAQIATSVLGLLESEGPYQGCKGSYTVKICI